MSDSVFAGSYAELYDAFYADKNYEAECDLVEAAGRRHGVDPLRRVLDIGCGTGGHALPLARRGFDVIGVDRSEAMLAEARRKAAAEGLAVDLRQGDLRELAASVPEPVDAALLMFAVLGYQTENDGVLAALRGARAALRPGGLLLLDVWYGPAVLAQRPGDRVRRARIGERDVLRHSSGRLDTERNVCEVGMRWWSFGATGVEERHEEHEMRYFFRPELELLLAQAGFEAPLFGAFPELDSPIGETTWNVVVSARAATTPSA